MALAFGLRFDEIFPSQARCLLQLLASAMAILYALRPWTYHNLEERGVSRGSRDGRALVCEAYHQGTGAPSGFNLRLQCPKSPRRWLRDCWRPVLF